MSEPIYIARHQAVTRDLNRHEQQSKIVLHFVVQRIDEPNLELFALIFPDSIAVSTWRLRWQGALSEASPQWPLVK